MDSTEIITPSRWTICYIIISKSLCISNVRNMQHLQACKRNFVTMAELVVVPSSYGYVIQATEICSFVFEKSKRKKKKNTETNWFQYSSFQNSHPTKPLLIEFELTGILPKIKRWTKRSRQIFQRLKCIWIHVELVSWKAERSKKKYIYISSD